MFRTALSKTATPSLRRALSTSATTSPSIIARRLFAASQSHVPLLAAQARRYPSALQTRFNSSSSSSPPPPQQQTDPSQVQIEPRLSLTFTCGVPDCGHRSTHEFSKRAYTKGLVIIQCPSCKNRHLIADNIGWFKTSEETQGGKLRTVEDFVKAKGETVRRGKQLKVLQDGETMEYVIEDPTPEEAESKPLA